MFQYVWQFLLPDGGSSVNKTGISRNRSDLAPVPGGASHTASSDPFRSHYQSPSPPLLPVASTSSHPQQQPTVASGLSAALRTAQHSVMLPTNSAFPAGHLDDQRFVDVPSVAPSPGVSSLELKLDSGLAPDLLSDDDDDDPLDLRSQSSDAPDGSELVPSIVEDESSATLAVDTASQSYGAMTALSLMSLGPSQAADRAVLNSEITDNGVGQSGVHPANSARPISPELHIHMRPGSDGRPMYGSPSSSRSHSGVSADGALSPDEA